MSREIKQLVQGQGVRNWQRQDLNPGSTTPAPKLCLPIGICSMPRSFTTNSTVHLNYKIFHSFLIWTRRKLLVHQIVKLALHSFKMLGIQVQSDKTAHIQGKAFGVFKLSFWQRCVPRGISSQDFKRSLVGCGSTARWPGGNTGFNEWLYSWTNLPEDSCAWWNSRSV